MNLIEHQHSMPQINMDVLEQDFLRKQPLNDSGISCLWLVVEAIIISILGLFPAIFVLQSPDYREYNVVTCKEHHNLNHIMEFWRYSAFFIAAYVAYIGSRIAIQLVPLMFVWLVEHTEAEPSYSWRKQFYLLRKMKGVLTMALFVISLLVLGAMFIYQSSFIESIPVIIKPVPREQLSGFLLERFCVFTLVFLLFYTISRYIVAYTTYHYHRVAHLQRINNVNYRYEVVFKLYQAISRGLLRKKHKPRVRYSGELFRDDLDLSTAQRTEEIAGEIFSHLCPSSRDYLKPEDFRPFFDQSEISKVSAIFDEWNSGQVTEAELATAINKIHQEKDTTEVSLFCAQRIIQKLARIFSIMAFILSVLVGVALFKLETTALVVVFGIVYVGFNFTVQATLSEIYDCCIFIFVKHPFDVGDRVIVRGESLLVDEIDLYTTIFRKWDHTAVYISNKDITNSTIYNIRRSGNTSEEVEIQVSTAAPMDKIWALKRRLNEFAKSKPRDFTGNFDVSSIDIIDSNQTKVTFFVEYQGNFQNQAQKLTRRKMLNAEMERVREEIGL